MSPNIPWQICKHNNCHSPTLLLFVKRGLHILRYCMLSARRYAEVCSRTRAEIERRGHGEGTQSWGKNSRHVACQAGPRPHPSPANCKGEGRRRRLARFIFPLALGNLCIACKTSQTFPGRPLRQCLLRTRIKARQSLFPSTKITSRQCLKLTLYPY